MRLSRSERGDARARGGMRGDLHVTVRWLCQESTGEQKDLLRNRRARGRKQTWSNILRGLKERFAGHDGTEVRVHCPPEWKSPQAVLSPNARGPLTDEGARVSCG